MRDGKLHCRSNSRRAAAAAQLQTVRL